MIGRIISGGQTGADRAALDVAIRLGIPHGGWIPKGRRTEAGRLPDKYELQELPTPSYSKRTEQNVLDSDGTVIISHGRLTGGSALTRELAKKLGRPCLHMDLNTTNAFEAAKTINSWIVRHNIETLNVAGPRASEDPKIYHATMDILKTAFYLNLIETNTPKASYTLPSIGRLMELSILPKTVDQAVERLNSELSLRNKTHIAKMSEDDLASLHPSLGGYVRAAFRLRSGNHTLVESCRFVSGKGRHHEDDAAAVIIRELWKQLRETHRLRVIK